MNQLSRITLLALLALALFPPFAQASEPASSKSFKGPLAVQLWSFREAFRKDVAGTLKRVHALGFTYVELAGYYGMTARQFRAELDRAGLKAVSMHIEYE